MTIQAAGGRSGFAHELVLHTTTAEMLEFVVAFAQDSVAADEPTLLAVRPETAAAVLDTVGPAPHLTVLLAIGQPGRPASDLRATDALLTDYLAKAPTVRILNQEPTVPASHWHEWRRLEAVVNLALARHSAWAVCVYDRHALTAERADDLCATHPLLWSAGQHRTNAGYQDPAEFISKHMDAPPDPVEHTAPAVELIDPSPAAARATITRFTQHSELPGAEIEGLILATSEAVANAIVHGRPPVVLRLWTQPGRLTTTVTDTGHGPTDPFAGLLPADQPDRQPGGLGLGLWISHQLVDITHRRHPGGYTIRMTATRAAHNGAVVTPPARLN
jgi:anti-sigma regulatory factor (Ser/Thr protein kinase)